MKKIFVLLFFLMIGVAYASEGSFEFKFDGGGSSSVNYSPSLYTFSDGLLGATENCSSYQEDFTKYNPDVSELGQMFGGEMSVHIDIKGQQEDKCIFDVIMQIGILGQQIYHCEISSERQKSLLLAMQDRSNEVFTETYETYSTLEDEDGNVVQKFPMKTTVTDNRFNIEWGKIVAQNCKTIQKELTEEDIQEVQKKFDTLSEEFKTSLQNCTPDSASRTLLFFGDSITIKGMENDECILENEDFTIKVPQDKLNSVQSWADFYGLIRDKQISQYHYADRYERENILWAIESCSHQSSGSKGSRTETLNEISIKTSLEYKYNSEGCEITFANVLERNQQEEDYSLICRISDEQMKNILQKYAELVDKYGEKATQNGSMMSFTSAQSNDETRAADKEIMAYLKNNSLCKMKQSVVETKDISE